MATQLACLRLGTSSLSDALTSATVRAAASIGQWWRLACDARQWCPCLLTWRWRQGGRSYCAGCGAGRPQRPSGTRHLQARPVMAHPCELQQQLLAKAAPGAFSWRCSSPSVLPLPGTSLPCATAGRPCAATATPCARCRTSCSSPSARTTQKRSGRRWQTRRLAAPGRATGITGAAGASATGRAATSAAGGSGQRLCWLWAAAALPYVWCGVRVTGSMLVHHGAVVAKGGSWAACVWSTVLHA